VATEKQKVQGLQLEAGAQVDKVETSKQGFLKNEDHIEIHFPERRSSAGSHSYLAG